MRERATENLADRPEVSDSIGARAEAFADALA